MSLTLVVVLLLLVVFGLFPVFIKFGVDIVTRSEAPHKTANTRTGEIRT
jgi:hypothetical protein